MHILDMISEDLMILAVNPVTGKREVVRLEAAPDIDKRKYLNTLKLPQLAMIRLRLLEDIEEICSVAGCGPLFYSIQYTQNTELVKKEIINLANTLKVLSKMYYGKK